MTRTVKVGGVAIGGGNPVCVQSMTNTVGVESTVKQIGELERAGCQLVRIAIPNEETARMVDKIKEGINIPLIADIHFDYTLALMCIERGIDKLRINPGNIGDESRVKAVVQAAKRKNIPIRIGVNGGSLDTAHRHDGIASEHRHDGIAFARRHDGIASAHGHDRSAAMVESALRHIDILERYDFDDIVVSLKSSNVVETIKAYRQLSELCNYPLHLGVTEAGLKSGGLIKSAIGIGVLLHEGIGDTIRVSLTDNPVEEVYAARDILKALGLQWYGYELISCPTCGRCKVDILGIAAAVDDMLRRYEGELIRLKKYVKVAVMGCAVNGPGEAADADIGIAGGDGCFVLFEKGKGVGRVSENEAVDVLKGLLQRM